MTEEMKKTTMYISPSLLNRAKIAVIRNNEVDSVSEVIRDRLEEWVNKEEAKRDR